ncbi:unnamed protein product [Brassica oleracea]
MEVESSKAVIELQVEEAETNSSSQESLPEPQLNHKPNRNSAERVQCSSIFVQLMKWMQTIHDGFVEEKLLCLGCNARLGYFNRARMQCSCGAWVNPAFQLHKEPIKL